MAMVQSINKETDEIEVFDVSDRDIEILMALGYTHNYEKGFIDEGGRKIQVWEPAENCLFVVERICKTQKGIFTKIFVFAGKDNAEKFVYEDFSRRKDAYKKQNQESFRVYFNYAYNGDGKETVLELENVQYRWRMTPQKVR